MRNELDTTTVVTRVAPSPTGSFHIGTARVALFNYLFAKKHGGTFILRFEDTDRSRSEEKYVKDITDALHWLSLKPDKVFRQSKHKETYRKYINTLLETGRAYCSKEPSKKDPSHEVTLVRYKNTEPVITFNDTLRGEITIDISDLGDFVIARGKDDPLYHLAVVIDDLEEKVTHVLRGDDHIINTPRQIALIRALGNTPPVYTHIPLIHSSTGGKLSKRKDAVSVLDFRKRGFMPEAVINTIALLGWHPKDNRELFTLEELIPAFSPEDIQKKEAVFDERKLRWFNKQYVQKIDSSRLRGEIVPAIIKRFPVRSRLFPRSVRAILRHIRERGTLFEEEQNAVLSGEYDYYFTPPVYDPSLLLPKSDLPKEKLISEVAEGLRKTNELLNTLGAYTQWREKMIREKIEDHAQEKGKSLVLWPLRVALSGREKSPDPFSITETVGKRRTLQRIRKALLGLKAVVIYQI